MMVIIVIVTTVEFSYLSFKSESTAARPITETA
jgi:hypothetical protein